MTFPPKPQLPPYAKIDPQKAAAKLAQPIDTARFAKAANFAAKGRDDLARRGYAPDGKKRPRRFSTWEVCRYVLPVAPAHLRRVLKAHPELPQGTGDGGAKWYSLEEILTLREHFAEEGAPNRQYLPWRPKGLPAKVVAVANFKGGVGKTGTAAHLAMSAALDGYKVLVIALDPLGSMTSIMGGAVSDEWQTAFPLIARDYAHHVMDENLVRKAAGNTELPLDETLREALTVSPRNLIQKTNWPNIDLIDAQLNLYWAEFQVPVWRMQLNSWPLRDALEPDLKLVE